MHKVPAYVWGFLALIAGIAAGGLMPVVLTPVANGTRTLLSWFVLVAPVLIVGALSPAIATLIRRGLAGRFVAAVLGWFVLATVMGSLLGMLVAALVFRLPLQPGHAAMSDAAGMLRELSFGGKASSAVISIVIAVIVGAIGVKVDRVYAVLRVVERGIAKAGRSIGFVIIPLVYCLGIMIGVNFGARLGMSHYALMIAYSAGMAVVWFLVYWLLLLPTLGHVRDRWKLLREYYLPTALFAAGTCSSLATIPVNIANAKKYGVRDEVADFVIPIGAIVHKGASAMQYMAYGPLIAGYVFGIEIGWSHLLVVWPFIVLYTMAAPGVPGAMGLALWTAVLFASLLGLEDPQRTTFIGTWVALAGGIPDMFRTSGNSTADGFAAIIFDRNFERFFKGATAPVVVDDPPVLLARPLISSPRE
ncbi:MAG: cation:dicarboxylase symporter family transporter [Cytophagaceae bacterium]|nr:cation:dicarboxylase symporter family transporter [Gemmatimonadaceae bacterium]